MNGRRRADVHAPGRVRGHEQFRLLKDFPAENEFLQITAGQAASRCLAVRSLDPETANDFFGQCLDFATLHQAIAHQSLLKRGEQGVVRQAQFRHGAVAQSFGGDECQSLSTSDIGAQMRDRLTGETDRRGVVAGQPLFTA
ncbi:hypothetical protein D3C85_1105350 [compost metagenome]